MTKILTESGWKSLEEKTNPKIKEYMSKALTARRNRNLDRAIATGKRKHLDTAERDAKTRNEYLKESVEDNILDFINFAADELNLDETPPIHVITDRELAVEQRSFGGYSPSQQCIYLNIAGRHQADVFRTLAHELTHFKQDIEGRLDESSGDTGSDIENEANAMAGIIMRNYAKHNSELFESVKYAGRDYTSSGERHHFFHVKNVNNGTTAYFDARKKRKARREAYAYKKSKELSRK